MQRILIADKAPESIVETPLGIWVSVRNEAGEPQH